MTTTFVRNRMGFGVGFGFEVVCSDHFEALAVIVVIACNRQAALPHRGDVLQPADPRLFSRPKGRVLAVFVRDTSNTGSRSVTLVTAMHCWVCQALITFAGVIRRMCQFAMCSRL